ncbi:MAG TPA: DUF167 domain-containing protein [Candidatus Limnocylindria bacterium]|nr:DUF167 domain-containing protein [Candidatus Limnocylindria bacterium]
MTADPELAIDERGGRAHFAVRLIPRASRSSVSGIREGALVVRVTAAPVNGAANRALVELLGKTLHVAPTSIRIESGATSARKRLSAPQHTSARLRAM